MSALARLAGKVPGWLYGAVLMCLLAGTGMLYQRMLGNAQGRAAVQAQWDADKQFRAAVETKAVAQRAAENLAQARQQAATSTVITNAYDEEINDVLSRLAAAAERMRKPAFCASAGPAAPAGAGGAEGGAAADPSSGLLPDAVARDIQALILQTEEVAATGRACQAFVRGRVVQ